MLRLLPGMRLAPLVASCRALAYSTAKQGSTAPPAQRAAASAAVPDQARVVIVGGGIIGCSIAYHLAKMGWKDTVLIERDAVTSGTTWHAAGLMVTFGSLSETSTEIRKYSRDLYGKLEAETGQATGFAPVGFIELAADPDRLIEYRRQAAFGRKCGLNIDEISPAQVKELFPLCKTDDLLAGFYVKEDGRVNPVDVTMALAKGARMHGAKIIENCSALGVTTANGRVTGVVTAGGTIKAEYVVNCAGMWARQLGEAAGVNIPNQAAEHYYLITDAIPELDSKWPVIEDPSSYAYIRPEGAGMMVGLFEPVAAAWNVNRIPGDFSFGEITPDWERMAPFVEKAMSRVPRTMEVGVKKFFCGPESFTPDLAPIVGEAPELRNYFVCAGLNSIGILSGGGMGRLMAHWIMHGKPDMDVTGFNVDRLHRFQATPEYRAARVVESLGLVYKTHYPTYQMKTARGIKKSPLYDRLAARGAAFKDVSGWEGADWYAPPGVKPMIDKLSWGRHNFFPYWAAEHAACRNGVIVMDMSFMAKFLVQGSDAGRILNRMSTANVDGANGMITYTQWLNDAGKMEADLTVTKLAADKFLVIGTDNMAGHVQTMLRRACGPKDHAFVTDVTSGYAQLNLQGPKSRALMQALVGPYADFSNEAFGFRQVREIAIGMAPVYCARITYLGELGYELYIPTELALHVYDRIVQVGAHHGLVHAGLKALASLRMEKGYRDYGHDMDNTDTLLEVGLGFTADFDKPGGFVGKEAVLKQKAIPGMLPKRLLQVLCKDPEPLMFHGEIVLRNGKAVGDIRAASYGHTLGGAVGLSMVEAHQPINKAYLESAEWQVDIAGRKYPAQVSVRPFYDPNNDRIKA